VPFATSHIFSFQEYTEEIERLQRDLEATRQRTGVYLAQAEYDEMLQHLESLAIESKEKVERIKALTEEKLKHEVRIMLPMMLFRNCFRISCRFEVGKIFP